MIHQRYKGRSVNYDTPEALRKDDNNDTLETQRKD